MIVIISDLHLTDKTFDFKDERHDISSEAFELFWDKITRIVEFNAPNSIKKITVVLLGDIFELRSTTRWIASDYAAGGARKLADRPWKERREAPPSKTCRKILLDIIRKNADCLRYLKNPRLFKSREAKSLLKLARLGRKNKAIDFEFIFVPGNHDSLVCFHKDEGLRKIIRTKLGWQVLLPDPEARRLWFVDQDFGLVADHGHRCDWIDFHLDYYQHPLGSLLSDTIGRLMYHIKTDKDISDSARKKLVRFGQNIDNVRPSSDRLRWVVNNVPRPENDREPYEALRRVLIASLVEIRKDSDAIFKFAAPLVRKKILFPGIVFKLLGMIVDGAIKDLIEEKPIADVLRKVYRWFSPPPWIKFILKIFQKKDRALPFWESKGVKDADWAEADLKYLKLAYEELKDLCDLGVKHVVFGHTHDYKLVPLGPIPEECFDRKTFYFNSGTWKRTIQKSLLKTKPLLFQKWARMTYIVFFNPKIPENQSHLFDVWHGNLQTEDDLG